MLINQLSLISIFKRYLQLKAAFQPTNNLMNFQFGPKFWLINESIKLFNSLINLNVVFTKDPNAKNPVSI